MTVKELTYKELDITFDELCRQMGYTEGLPDIHTMEEIDRVTAEVAERIVPRIGFVVKRGRLNKCILETDGVKLHIGNTIANQLRHSEAFAFFVATAGEEFETYQRQLADEGDLVRSFIADSLGSLIAENAAKAMEKALQAAFDKLGWHHTNRFSPGYCSWPLADQHTLFSLMGERPCGVTLNDSSLMTPIKSVSGVVGVGANVSRLDYTCRICGIENCRLRHT